MIFTSRRILNNKERLSDNISKRITMTTSKRFPITKKLTMIHNSVQSRRMKPIMPRAREKMTTSLRTAASMLMETNILMLIT